MDGSDNDGDSFTLLCFRRSAGCRGLLAARADAWESTQDDADEKRVCARQRGTAVWVRVLTVGLLAKLAQNLCGICFTINLIL